MCLASSAQAQFIFPGRATSFDITFANNDFSDANAYYQTAEDAYSIGGPATTVYILNLKSDQSGFGWVGYGGTSVSMTSKTKDTATADLTSDGNFGGFVYSYNTLPETDFSNLGTFGNTWLVRKDFGGFVGLEFQGGGSGVVDASGFFTLDLLINGNWSNIGTGPFQTEFIGLNPNWQIDKSFVFDGVNTEFQAHIGVYGGNDPNLDFILHGPIMVTPEPSAFILLATLGITGASFLARRRQSRKAV